MTYKGSDKERAAKRAWYHRNKEKVCAEQRAAYAADPEKHRAKMRRCAGIVNPPGTRPEGPCEICGTNCKLVLDHDHSTGRVRGWLCNECNWGLGHFKDQPARMRLAANYIEKSKT